MTDDAIRDLMARLESIQKRCEALTIADLCSPIFLLWQAHARTDLPDLARILTAVCERLDAGFDVDWIWFEQIVTAAAKGEGHG